MEPIPKPLLRRLVLTFLVGTGCFFTGLVFFLHEGDTSFFYSQYPAVRRFCRKSHPAWSSDQKEDLLCAGGHLHGCQTAAFQEQP